MTTTPESDHELRSMDSPDRPEAPMPDAPTDDITVTRADLLRKAAAFDRLVGAIKRERAEAVEIFAGSSYAPAQLMANANRDLCDRLLGVADDG